MSDSGKKQKLGRGLSALLGEDRTGVAGSSSRNPTQQSLSITQLRPGKFQPRQQFDDTRLQELADSIREKGILQPVLVRPLAGEEGQFEIIAGERRWRAAQLARLHEIPVLIRDLTDTESLELALIENVQRADLNPLEESRGYARLIDQFGHSQEAIGRIVGKSRSHVANMLRLLALPAAVHKMLEQNLLTAGHARALITAANPEALARKIIDQNLSVRDAEALARQQKPQANKIDGSAKSPKPQKDADTLALEERLSGNLGLKIQIDHRGQKGGVVTISYRTLEQLDDLCHRLGSRNL